MKKNLKAIVKKLQDFVAKNVERNIENSQRYANDVEIISEHVNNHKDDVASHVQSKLEIKPVYNISVE